LTPAGRTVQSLLHIDKRQYEEPAMTLLSHPHHALAASHDADLRREACLARLARAARPAPTAGPASPWRRTVARSAARHLRLLLPAGVTTAPIACCA
jgi:hypothetical protein